ncbi:SDR family NAD(P)-dependent oxidoreductase [Thiomicrorhabdus indica]|uniref:SDR family NAD(P)-dependent oxidoreductase n=1 Tax=Thiomicrorhabdus indica TaxID=2267253 RepID=UPI002AA7A645|nr:SDR family NAD(P)-dependent oxidoreductase [Thiomicrorhabdus indica]
MTLPKNVWVLGASGGIGLAFAKQVRQNVHSVRLIGFARHLEKIPAGLFDEIYPVDFEHKDQFSAQLTTFNTLNAPDWLFIATGWLHDENTKPEKTYQSLNAEHLMRSYHLNAVAPSLFIQAVLQQFGVKQATKIGVLSARLASITDNRMGGWHSYRASKVALNMLLKNFALELTRKRSNSIVFAIQPGTTDTALSKPFQKGLPANQLQTPEFTAEKIFDLFQQATIELSGNFIDFEGRLIAP